jgi:hypothetical protein
MESEERAQRLLHQACGEIKVIAPGWNQQRLAERIGEIQLFATPSLVPLDQRRRIARLARKLDKEIELAGIGVGTVESEPVFLSHLRLLGTIDGVVHLPVWGKAPQSQSKRGGARRSGLRSLRGSVLGKIVRLYCEAHANPRFSPEGPLVRFANMVGELALDEAKPFTPNAVKAEFWRMKLKARRTDLQR